jgi:hypothetical protein
VALLGAAPSAVDLYRERAPGTVAVGFAFVGTLLVSISPQLIANSYGSAWHLRGERNHLVAGRTATGWRTIDLTRIRTVRCAPWPHRYGGGFDEYLVVVDANGSRIGFRTTDQGAMRWVHDAVVASTSTGVRVSSYARTTLGIDRRQYFRYLPCHDAHPLLYTLATWAVMITAYVGIVGLTVS